MLEMSVEGLQGISVSWHHRRVAQPTMRGMKLFFGAHAGRASGRPCPSSYEVGLIARNPRHRRRPACLHRLAIIALVYIFLSLTAAGALAERFDRPGDGIACCAAKARDARLRPAGGICLAMIEALWHFSFQGVVGRKLRDVAVVLTISPRWACRRKAAIWCARRKKRVVLSRLAIICGRDARWHENPMAARKCELAAPMMIRQN